jgi:hypothetical protein
MSDVVITVRGSFDSFHPAERGTVKLQAGLEGPVAETVYAHTVATANAITDRITPLVDHTGGPITYWSSDQVRTWANRPWNNEGKQLPLVHHAVVNFEIKFSDLGRLGRWVSEVAPMAGVSVQGIEWALTVARRDTLTAQARAAAVLDAQDRALAYAASLDLRDVRVLAIADVGMLGDQIAYAGDAGAPKFARAAAMTSAAGPDLDLVPVDIKISAAVDARFLAATP